MSIGGDFLRWQAGCWDGGGFGVTHGDTFYRGLRAYSQPYPCPNGFVSPPVEFEKIRAIPAYQRMIEKARRDAEEWGSVIRVRELAEVITVDEIQNDLKEIKAWAQSLQKKARSASGSTKSTTLATS